MPIWNSELCSINLDEQSSLKEIYCSPLKYQVIIPQKMNLLSKIDLTFRLRDLNDFAQN
jgi:hypothetical protein